MAFDPVCGLEVEETDSQIAAEYDGCLFYFCSDECKKEFELDPEDYVAAI